MNHIAFQQGIANGMSALYTEFVDHYPGGSLGLPLSKVTINKTKLEECSVYLQVVPCLVHEATVTLFDTEGNPSLLIRDFRFQSKQGGTRWSVVPSSQEGTYFFLLSLSMKRGGFPSWLGQKPHLNLFTSLSMQASQPLNASLLMPAIQSAKYFRCLKCSNSYFSAALTSTRE